VSYSVRFEGGALVQLNGLPAVAFDALLERVVVLVDEPWDAAVIPPGMIMPTVWQCSALVMDC
jgi:hypothetical protein